MPQTLNISSHRVLTVRASHVNSSDHLRVRNSHEAVQSCNYSGLWAATGAAVGMLSGGVIGLALAAYGTPDRSQHGEFHEMLLTVVSAILGVIGGGLSGFMAERLFSSSRQIRVEELETQELQSLDAQNDDLFPVALSLLSSHLPDYEELPLPPAYEGFHCEYAPPILFNEPPPAYESFHHEYESSILFDGDPPPAYETLSLHSFSWFPVRPELTYGSLRFDQNNATSNEE